MTDSINNGIALRAVAGHGGEDAAGGVPAIALGQRKPGGIDAESGRAFALQLRAQLSSGGRAHRPGHQVQVPSANAAPQARRRPAESDQPDSADCAETAQGHAGDALAAALFQTVQVQTYGQEPVQDQGQDQGQGLDQAQAHSQAPDQTRLSGATGDAGALVLATAVGDNSTGALGGVQAGADAPLKTNGAAPADPAFMAGQTEQADPATQANPTASEGLASLAGANEAVDEQVNPSASEAIGADTAQAAQAHDSRNGRERIVRDSRGTEAMHAPAAHSHAYQAAVAGERNAPALGSHAYRASVAAAAAAGEIASGEDETAQDTPAAEVEPGTHAGEQLAAQAAMGNAQPATGLEQLDQADGVPSETMADSTGDGRLAALSGQAAATTSETSMSAPPANQPTVPEAGTAASEAIEQVMARVKAFGTPGVRTVEVQLRPESLGRVFLRVSEDASGLLQALIRVESPEVAQAMRERLDDLARGLASHGLKIGQLSVGTSQPANAGSGSGSAASDHLPFGAGTDAGGPQGQRYGQHESGHGRAHGPEEPGRGAPERVSASRTQQIGSRLGAAPREHRLDLVA